MRVITLRMKRTLSKKDFMPMQKSLVHGAENAIFFSTFTNCLLSHALKEAVFHIKKFLGLFLPKFNATLGIIVRKIQALLREYPHCTLNLIDEIRI